MDSGFLLLIKLKCTPYYTATGCGWLVPGIRNRRDLNLTKLSSSDHAKDGRRTYGRGRGEGAMPLQVRTRHAAPQGHQAAVLRGLQGQERPDGQGHVRVRVCAGASAALGTELDWIGLEPSYSLSLSLSLSVSHSLSLSLYIYIYVYIYHACGW